MMKKAFFTSILILLIGFISIGIKAENNLASTNQTIQLTAPAGVSYRWFLNGNLIDGKEEQNIAVSLNGSYLVEVIQADGSMAIVSFVVSGTSKVTIYVIGDSTASVYDADLYPRKGWAQVLQPFFNADSIVVSDKAASGRSSKSFYEEKGKWDAVAALLKTGDYLFIQFAHNDEKTDSRYTDPATTFKDYMKIYINTAREKGAFPVLISSIPRNNWSGSGIQQAHKPYTLAMKQVADSLKVPFIDMEAGTMAYLNPKGKTYATDSVFMNLKSGVWANYPTGNFDGTHLQEKGAFELCGVLTSAMKSPSAYPEMTRLSNNLCKAVRVAAMPSPNLKGTISGNGIFVAGSDIRLTATPASGYRFVKWTSASDTTALSTSATYLIGSCNENISLTAHFELKTAVLAFTGNPKCKIYPNPAIDRLMMDFSSEASGMGEIGLTNLAGQTAMKIQEPISKGKNTCCIDVSSLARGVYNLTFKMKQEFKVFQFIKQ